MAEQGEACSSVHLMCDPFGLGVDAFGGAVAVRKRECGFTASRSRSMPLVKACR